MLPWMSSSYSVNQLNFGILLLVSHFDILTWRKRLRTAEDVVLVRLSWQCGFPAFSKGKKLYNLIISGNVYPKTLSGWNLHWMHWICIKSTHMDISFHLLRLGWEGWSLQDRRCRKVIMTFQEMMTHPQVEANQSWWDEFMFGWIDQLSY